VKESFVSRSPEETWAFARTLVASLPPRCVLALHGQLGAGKTCLVQGIARALGIDGVVNSPTYTIINEYAGSRPLHHIDLYRVSGPREALALGLEEYFERDGITAIEWAERAADVLPPEAVHVFLEPGGSAEERRLTVRKGDAA
jgi:tRNA threonylcarbamoyladenosine biosynthesis protein TsaE